jgi:hypothetical protein
VHRLQLAVLTATPACAVTYHTVAQVATYFQSTMGGMEVYNTETWEMSALFNTTFYLGTMPTAPYTAVRVHLTCQASP